MDPPLRRRAITAPFPSPADRALRLAEAAAPGLALALVGLPVLTGLLFTLLPAFGWLPALGGTSLSPEPFRMLLAQPGIWRSAALSLGTGLAASLLSLVLAALVLASFGEGRALRSIRAALAPLLALPHAAAGFALAFLLAPSGLLFRLAAPLAGWTAPPDRLVVNDPLGLSLTLGLTLKETPFLLLVLLAALPQAGAQPRGRVTAALGYGRVAGFLFAVWPALYRQARLPVLAVVAFSTSIVDMAAILGPTLPPPLSPRLVLWMNDPDLSRRFLACAGAVMQLGLSLLAILLWLGLERLGALLRDGLVAQGRRFAGDLALRVAAGGLVVTGLLALATGAAALLLWSFAGRWPFPNLWPDAISLRTWGQVTPSLTGPLWNTLLIGCASAGISLTLCVLWLSRHVTSAPRSARPAPPLIRLPAPLRPSASHRLADPAESRTELRPRERGEDTTAAPPLLNLPSWRLAKTDARAHFSPFAGSRPGPAIGRIGQPVAGRRAEGCRQADEGRREGRRCVSLRTRRLETILYLPLLVPQPTFLFGLQLLFLHLGLTPGLGTLVLAHLVFVLPYVLLALSGPWIAFDRRFEAVSASFGHGAARTLLAVRLPMLLPALLAAFAIGFAVSCGLYLPTLLVGAGRVATVTTEAVALASGADRRVIGAVAFVQALLPWAGFAVALGLPVLLSRHRRGLRT